MASVPLCPKHSQEAVFICSVESCHENRLICETCKQKQTLHFSHHANYIYRYKQFIEFNNGKTTIPRLEKGITDCENYITVHKRYYSDEINEIKSDFDSFKKQFNIIANKFEDIYVQGFQKEIDKFDEQIGNIKLMFKEYVKEKSQQDSFFTMLFHEKNKTDENMLESIVQKNSKAFNVRADIINLRSSIAMAKNNKTKYKATEKEQRILSDMHNYLGEFSTNFFDKFKQILGSYPNENESLKSSIVSETKSLAMSRVSMGTPLELLNDMKKSQISMSSQRNLQRVAFPELNSKVAAVRDRLKPLNPPKANIVMEGPYLYSTGVYYGQLENNKRQGWGQFAFADGSIYEGFWQNDMMSGYGRLIRKDCYYEGDVKNGKANGKGNYEDQYRTYTGEWRNDKRNGVGEEQFKKKKKKYIGAFVDDKYNGKGKLFDQEYVYEGKFKDGLFHGDGRINYNNREVFEGSFERGMKQLGRHTYPDGSYYDGMFKNNIPHKTGQFFWSDGLKYSGQWENGVQEGIGVQILPDGRQFKGLWRGGKWEKWL